jgi:pyrroloquinoline quinone biosynthesis protein E
VSGAPRPYTLVAELTYACPLRCAYCSNPVSAQQRAAPLTTSDWRRLIREAEELGVMQVHFTGGEPLLYAELEDLVSEARGAGLYVNLITSGLPLSRERLAQLQQAGLDHLQLSLQAVSPAASRRIAGVDALARKRQTAVWARELGLALTINIVLHRQNLAELPALLAVAEELGPERIELANAQYLGWALLNRAQLLPSGAQIDVARAIAAEAKQRLAGRIEVLFVLPDYYADRPRACMSGWAERYLVVTPDGLLLPCHAARDLPGLVFDDVRRAPLAALWAGSSALNRYRGDGGLPDACRSCDGRHGDRGGCRCQAFQLTGDAEAVDPACRVAPAHSLVRRARTSFASPELPELQLRRAPEMGCPQNTWHGKATS